MPLMCRGRASELIRAEGHYVVLHILFTGLCDLKVELGLTELHWRLLRVHALASDILSVMLHPVSRSATLFHHELCILVQRVVLHPLRRQGHLLERRIQILVEPIVCLLAGSRAALKLISPYLTLCFVLLTECAGL